MQSQCFKTLVSSTKGFSFFIPLSVCSYAQCVSIPWRVGQSTGSPLFMVSSCSLYCSSTDSCLSWPLLSVRTKYSPITSQQQGCGAYKCGQHKCLQQQSSCWLWQWRRQLLRSPFVFRPLSSGVDVLQAVLLCFDLALITIKQRPQKVSGATNVVIAA